MLTSAVLSNAEQFSPVPKPSASWWR